MTVTELIALAMALIQLGATFFSMIGIVAIIITVKADHEWRRRQYALDIIAKWNANAIEHIEAVEKRFSDIRYEKTAEITKAQALEIYKTDLSKEDIVNNIELRTHLIQLLNFFEYICTSYTQRVADQAIIDASMKGTIIVWYDKLRNFIEVVEEIQGYQPWSPFIEVVTAWKKAGFKFRKPTM